MEDQASVWSRFYKHLEASELILRTTSDLKKRKNQQQMNHLPFQVLEPKRCDVRVVAGERSGGVTAQPARCQS